MSQSDYPGKVYLETISGLKDPDDHLERIGFKQVNRTTYETRKKVAFTGNNGAIYIYSKN